jgi:hypothetical protein
MAHLCPDPSLFDMLNGATTDKPAAATDATTLTPAEAVTRFTDCAEILRATPMSKETVISWGRSRFGGACDPVTAVTPFTAN